MFDAIIMTPEEVRNMSNEDYTELYKENEHYNLHVENMVLEAKRYGKPWLIKKCENFNRKYQKMGYVGGSLSSEYYAIYENLKEAKNFKN